MSEKKPSGMAALLAERLQSGVPLAERPYASLASELGCDEATVLTLTEGLIRDGFIRSFGAFIDFERLGYEGLLCGLIVPEAQIDGAMSRLDGHEITHSYLRAHEVNLWITAVMERPETGRFMDRLRSCGLPFVALSTEARLKLSPVFSFNFNSNFNFNLNFNFNPPNPACEGEQSRAATGSASAPHASHEKAGKEAPAVLSAADLAALAALQRDFPVAPKPFEPAAMAMGLTVSELLDLLRGLKASRVLRRIGASLHHVRVGYSANALAAWRTEDAYAAGSRAASFPWVSHCYVRREAENTLPFPWPYTLYTMLHAPDSESLQARLKALSDALAANPAALPTLKELKKTRPAIIARERAFWNR